MCVHGNEHRKKNSCVMFKEKSMRVAFYCAHKFVFF